MIKKLFFFVIFVVLAIGAMAAAQQAAEQTQKIDLGPAEAWAPGAVKTLPQFKIIIFSDKEGVYAMSTDCPHRHCVVGFRAKQDSFVCPCHASRFAADGKVLQGPATTDLEWFEVSADSNGRLVVDKKKTVPRGTKWHAR